MSYPRKEAVHLSEQLGIDFETDKEYRWFLNQALLLILPLGWKKEYDPFGYIQYHNSNNDVTTQRHPLIYKFRAAFLKLTQNKGMNPKAIEQSTYETKKTAFRTVISLVEDAGELPHQDAQSFYAILLEHCRTGPPVHIEESLDYQLVEPAKMMKKAETLGIANDYRLLWVARTFAVLLVPPL